MIVPVAFKLERPDTGEEFVTTNLRDVAFNAYTRIKFSVDLFEVETGYGRGVSGLLLVDAAERDPFRAGGVLTRFTGPGEEHKDYLRRLRAAIDEVLGDDD